MSRNTDLCTLCGNGSHGYGAWVDGKMRPVCRGCMSNGRLAKALNGDGENDDEGEGHEEEPPPAKPARDFTCARCGCQTADNYMVHNQLWATTKLPRKGAFLHLKCLEDIIDRSLTLGDFTDAPVNDIVRWAFGRGRGYALEAIGEIFDTASEDDCEE